MIEDMNHIRNPGQWKDHRAYSQKIQVFAIGGSSCQPDFSFYNISSYSQLYLSSEELIILNSKGEIQVRQKAHTYFIIWNCHTTGTNYYYIGFQSTEMKVCQAHTNVNKNERRIWLELYKDFIYLYSFLSSIRSFLKILTSSFKVLFNKRKFHIALWIFECLKVVGNMLCWSEYHNPKIIPCM